MCTTHNNDNKFIVIIPEVAKYLWVTLVAEINDFPKAWTCNHKYLLQNAVYC